MYRAPASDDALGPGARRLVLPKPARATALWPLLLFAAGAAFIDWTLVAGATELTAARRGEDVRCRIVRTSALRREEEEILLVRPKSAVQQYQAGRPPSHPLLADTATGLKLVLSDSNSEQLRALEAVIASPSASPTVAVAKRGWRYSIAAGFFAIFVAPIALLFGLSRARRRRLVLEREGARARLDIVEGGVSSWSSGVFAVEDFRETRFEDRPGAIYKVLVVDVGGRPPFDVPVRIGYASAREIERFLS